ncbi:MAG: 5-oxoprolinase subunit PxpB [Azospirillaceae bacterium]
MSRSARIDAPRFAAAGDTVVMVVFGEAIEDKINDAVLALDRALLASPPPGLVETVPAYTNLSIHFDPLVTDHAAVERHVRALTTATAEAAPATARRWRLPVCYGGEHGIDLEALAARHGLSAQAVIDRHTGRDHRIYMLGFMPGFAFMGGLDPDLATERLADPRPRVPAGSVGIGGAQTGVFSVAAPSGWHLLGRTPVRTYDTRLAHPFLFAPGDRVRFTAIGEAEYRDLCGQVEAGERIVEPEQVRP